MVWPLVAMFATSAVGSMHQQSQQKKQIQKQNKLNAETNRANFLAAEQTALSIGVQKAAAKQQTTKNLELVQRSAYDQGGSVQAAAAAAGIKGNAVQAVLQTIQADYSSARFEQMNQLEWNMYDLNMQINNTYSAARRGELHMQSTPSSGKMLGNALMSGAMSAGSAYAGQYFNIGATKP